MPNRGKKGASKAKHSNDTSSQASSSSGPSAASSNAPAPLSRAELVNVALERQKKRAARASEKRKESEALKNTGNELFQGGDYQGAVNMYQRAIDQYGSTPVLNSNLAAAYLKLKQYCNAEKAATDALVQDPKMLKARFRRGLARKGLGRFESALRDFETVVDHDPNLTEAHDQISITLDLLDEADEYLDASDYEEESEADWPDYDDDACSTTSDAESDSSDCRHTGNSVPCRYYNHNGCSRKDNCRFSHAPDDYSIRDKLGRNVCIYYLLDRCRFGDEACVYAHDRSFLPHGWWDHSETVAIIQSFESMQLEMRGKSFITEMNNQRKKYTAAKQERLQGAHSTLRFVLLILLDGDTIEQYKLPTIAALQAQAPVKKALTRSEALLHLASPDLAAVFVADAALANNPDTEILVKLAEFAHSGGSVVMGGSFSSFVSPAELARFFSKTWKLEWKSGSYHSATFTLNMSHELAKSSASLPKSYSMKALHVNCSDNTPVMYRESGGNPKESPVVQVPFGKGRMGYIGDVNWEQGSITVLLNMLGLSKSTAPPSNVPQPSPSAGPSTTSRQAQEDKDGQSKDRFVLILALDGAPMEEYKQPTINLIKSKSPLKTATSKSDASILLSSNDIVGVFVADAGITSPKNAQVLAQLVEYAKGGGSVIIGGSFSTFVKLGKLDTFFLKSWGVPWKAGSYHRTTFSINSAHELVKANPSLPVSYSMKALHVKDISPDVIVYRPTSESRVESLVFPASPITNLTESPAVRTRVGNGYMAFIGDVNWEESSAKLLLAMLGLLNPPTKPAKPESKHGSTTNTVPPSSGTTPKPTPVASTPSNAAPASLPPAATPTKATGKKKPFVMLLSLEDQECFSTSHVHCLSALRDKIDVSPALTVSSALTMLDNTDLAGIFITDAGIVNPEYKDVLPRLVKYVKQGGIVIVGGLFSSFISSPDMNKFFNGAWGISWKSGAYHRARFSRNSTHEVVIENPSLVSSYSMKALHISNLVASDPVYLPTDDAHLQSPLPFNDFTESPVVRRKIGEGYLGYIGDVNAETETTSLVLAMFGLLDNSKPQPVPAPSSVEVKPQVQSIPLNPRAEPTSRPTAQAKDDFQTLPVGPTRRPFMIIMSFGNEKFFAGVQGDLLDLLKSKLEVLHGLSNERVVELLGSQDLVGVFITDASIVEADNAYLLNRLVAFSKAGGTVVLGGSFSSFIRYDELGPFFQDAWGVPWKSGDYTRCEITVNKRHELGTSKMLPSEFTMKGLFIVGTTPETALYVPANDTHVAAYEVPQTPVAMVRVGKGKLGYIGDVGLQDENSKIVLAMFALSG